MPFSPFPPLLACMLVLEASASAASFNLAATNPGPITGTGRDMVFDLSDVTGEINSAKLLLSVNYSNARELGFTLVDSTGGVSMPILPTFGVPSSNLSMIGTYRITDQANVTWQQGGSSPGVDGNLSPKVDVRAWQFGPGGVCLNLLGRFLEYDIDRNQPLTLRVARLATPSPGSGSINQAALVIETDVVPLADELLATGFEEPFAPLVRCQRPPLDLTPNGAPESNLSPLSLLEFNGPTLNWKIRSLANQNDYGPYPFGPNSTDYYAGRFGGRSRMNFGYWDYGTGTLHFTTGAGARTLSLAGDWTSVLYTPIPGDYDGDGTTDLAMVFLDESAGPPGDYTARIRYSSTDITRDYIVDPRQVVHGQYFSTTINFGPGQDTDGDGRDEIMVYSRISDASANMRLLRIAPNPTRASSSSYEDGPTYGFVGDLLILGDWSTDTSGNQRGLMVARKSASGWNWYRFPSNTPVAWGSQPNSDLPISIDADGDGLNDIAVYRVTDRGWYLIRSSDGQLAAPLAIFGLGPLFQVPLGFYQGIIPQ
jgi:hypothetical protein